MLLSEDYKFLFIHISKTAGTALTLELLKYCDAKTRLVHKSMRTRGVGRVLHIATGGKPFERLTGLSAHPTYSEIQNQIGAKRFSEYHSFCVVRNPFVRAMSIFDHLKAKPSHDLADLVRGRSFREALPNLMQRGFFFQVRRITDREVTEISVDRVIPYEKLDSGLVELSAFLGLPETIKIRRINVSARNEKRDVEAAYSGFADEFIERFADDFRLLNYSTDPARAYEPPLANSA